MLQPEKDYRLNFHRVDFHGPNCNHRLYRYGRRFVEMEEQHRIRLLHSEN